MIAFLTPTAEHMSKHKNPTLTQLGRNLKRLRIAANMSQEELAFAADIDRTFVSGIERGVSNPTLHTLMVLCDALNTTMLEIVQGVESCPPGLYGPRRKNAAKPQMPTLKRRLR